MIIHYWLSVRQLKHIMSYRNKVPNVFADKISLEAHQKSADYNVAKIRCSGVELAISSSILLLWTVGGGLELLQQHWSVGGPLSIWNGVGFVLSAFIISSFIELPVSLYQTFGLETRFGFNRTTIRTFFSDLVKQLVLLIIIGGPLVFAVLWLMDFMGEHWWLYVWILWSVFTLILIWLYPLVIAPLFNKFIPFNKEPLNTKINELFKRNELNLSGILVMDGSKRSSHGNAYFTGFGANKRIVFFDTLLNGLNDDEIEAVLAHEVGHFKRKHIQKQLVIRLALSLLALSTLGWLHEQIWFYNSLGVEQKSDAAALLLFLFVFPVFTTCLRPLGSWLSRKHEFEADEFAASQTPATTLIQALVKLYQDNAATLTPDPLYSAFHDSHPPAPVRVARLAALAVADKAIETP